MEYNPLLNTIEFNTARQLEEEEKLLEEKSKEVLDLLLEKENSLTEKAEILQGKVAMYLGPFKILGEDTVIREQNAQQKEVEEYFKNDPSVKVSSFLNDMDGSSKLDLTEELKKIKEGENTMVLLINGITGLNIYDFEQVSPRLRKFFEIFRRFNIFNMARYGLDLTKITKGNTVADYIINTTTEVQKQLFDKKPLNVLIVRNASSRDLSAVTQNGGENTVLVVQGHGRKGLLSMTDKNVQSTEIPIPQNKLKAFVQHTCAHGKEEEEMGKSFAKQTFGWDRKTFHSDYREQPLHPRTNFNSAE